MEDFEFIFGEISKHSQDLDWLCDTAIKLSTQLYFLNTETGEAELAENQAAVGLLESTPPDGKKMSVAEAEKRALVLTLNAYGIKKMQGQAVVEVIQSLKKKIDMLSFEKKNG